MVPAGKEAKQNARRRTARGKPSGGLQRATLPAGYPREPHDLLQ
jgi:hypothetical protein